MRIANLTITALPSFELGVPARGTGYRSVDRAENGEVATTVKSHGKAASIKSSIFSDDSKRWRYVELGVLVAVVVVVWGLLFLPLIFYHIPDEPSTGSRPPVSVHACAGIYNSRLQEYLHVYRRV